MDPRHGKRPLLSSSDADESEENYKRRDDEYHPRYHYQQGGGDDSHLDFPVYSARSQDDMSAMVSALAQVIGNSSNVAAPDHGVPSQVLHANPHQDAQHHQYSQLLGAGQGTKIKTLVQYVIYSVGVSQFKY